MNKACGLTMGALSDSIEVQLRRQGLTLGSEDAERRIQRWHDEIISLGIHGLLTHTEGDRARKRLMKKISAMVRPITPAGIECGGTALRQQPAP